MRAELVAVKRRWHPARADALVVIDRGVGGRRPGSGITDPDRDIDYWLPEAPLHQRPQAHGDTRSTVFLAGPPELAERPISPVTPAVHFVAVDAACKTSAPIDGRSAAASGRASPHRY